MKNICPLFNPAAFNTRIIPEPKIPANPVPDPKKPTVELGNPLQKPRVVLSPKADPTPRIMDEISENQKETSN